MGSRPLFPPPEFNKVCRVPSCFLTPPCLKTTARRNQAFGLQGQTYDTAYVSGAMSPFPCLSRDHVSAAVRLDRATRCDLSHTLLRADALQGAMQNAHTSIASHHATSFLFQTPPHALQPLLQPAQLVRLGHIVMRLLVHVRRRHVRPRWKFRWRRI